MIFVTVGTERFPFDRLLRAVDDVHDILRDEPVFMQTGWSTYTPACAHEPFLPFREVRKKVREARIVVGHAGAGTLLLCANCGKIPIMMARKHCLGEHIDDHQQMLAQRMARRGLILLAEDSASIRESILGYDAMCAAVDARDRTEPALVNDLKLLLANISDGDRG